MGGIIGDVISGNQIQEYTISNWVPSPFPGLAMPQQTHNTGEYTAIFILGGMYAEIIFSLFFCLLIYVTFNFKTKVWILVIPLFTTIRQFLSNFLCGTDEAVAQTKRNVPYRHNPQTFPQTDEI